MSILIRNSWANFAWAGTKQCTCIWQAWESRDSDRFLHASTITCTAAPRVWHFSAFHYVCPRCKKLRSACKERSCCCSAFYWVAYKRIRSNFNLTWQHAFAAGACHWHGPPKLADQERTYFTGKNRTLAPLLQRQTVLRTPFKLQAAGRAR